MQDWHKIRLDAKTNLPLYLQLAQKLKDLIADGKLQPGEQLPPSRELQQTLHLSSITIENGLKQLVKEQVLVRQPRRGTFVRQTAFASSVGAPPVEIIFSNIPAHDGYWFIVLSELERQLRSGGFPIRFRQISSQETFVPAMLDSHCPGVILCGYNSRQLADAIESAGIPVVLIGSLNNQHDSLAGLDAAIHDDEERAMMSVRHLLDLRHRELVCVTGPRDSEYALRQKNAFIRALSEREIAVDDAMFYTADDLDCESGIKVGYQLFCRQFRPSAIYCNSDYVAIGIIHAAEKLGIKIPQEVSIIGGGGFNVAQLSRPKLTTTCGKPRELADVAAEKLLGRIADPAKPKSVVKLRIDEISFGDSTMVYRKNPLN